MIEDILQDVFKCKKPFKNNGELSVNGAKAYGKLIDLIYRLEDVGVLHSSASSIIDQIDAIIDTPIDTAV